MVEITSVEQNKVKRMKRTEGCLRDLRDNIMVEPKPQVGRINQCAGR